MQILKNKGITILEIIIVVSITIIIVSVVTLNLSNFKKNRTLENTTSEIISFINEARNNTISSLNSNNYSLHFEDDRVVLFSGSVYNSSASDNKTIIFQSSIEISEIDGIGLYGGGQNIVFEKITGETNNYGTITIRLKSDTNIYNVINVSRLGVVSKN